MKIRMYEPGDEAIQAAIYNEAAAGLPKFKAATADEVRRRTSSSDFEPTSRFYAVDGGRVVGYTVFNANGRLSYPWCRPGCEHAAEPLFQAVIQAMESRGLRLAFAAYRKDWPEQQAFWERRGFRLAREMLNFSLELVDMPTRAPRPGNVSFLRREDVPAIFQLAPSVLGVSSASELETYFFENPYFSSESVFVMRNRLNGAPTSAGILITNPAYASVATIDPNMPCYRLGAFGTEKMQCKRINGVFSVLTRDGSEALEQAMMLMEYAALRLEELDHDTFAAQVPSDVPHLVRFYKQNFQRQGAFPVYEKILATAAPA